MGVFRSRWKSRNPEIPNRISDPREGFFPQVRVPAVSTTSINKNQAIEVLCLRFLPECLNKKTAVPGSLKDIDPTGFH